MVNETASLSGQSSISSLRARFEDSQVPSSSYSSSSHPSLSLNRKLSSPPPYSSADPHPPRPGSSASTGPPIPSKPPSLSRHRRTPSDASTCSSIVSWSSTPPTVVGPPIPSKPANLQIRTPHHDSPGGSSRSETSLSRSLSKRHTVSTFSGDADHPHRPAHDGHDVKSRNRLSIMSLGSNLEDHTSSPTVHSLREIFSTSDPATPTRTSYVPPKLFNVVTVTSPTQTKPAEQLPRPKQPAPPPAPPARTPSFRTPPANKPVHSGVHAVKSSPRVHRRSHANTVTLDLEDDSGISVKGLRDIWEKLSIENGWHLQSGKRNRNAHASFNSWAKALQTSISRGSASGSGPGSKVMNLVGEIQNGLFDSGAASRTTEVKIRGGGGLVGVGIGKAVFHDDIKEEIPKGLVAPTVVEIRDVHARAQADLAGDGSSTAIQGEAASKVPEPSVQDTPATSAGDAAENRSPVARREIVTASNFEIAPPRKESSEHTNCDMIVCGVKTFMVNDRKVHEIELKCHECDSVFILTAGHECAEDEEIVLESDDEEDEDELLESDIDEIDNTINDLDPATKSLFDEVKELDHHLPLPLPFSPTVETSTLQAQDALGDEAADLTAAPAEQDTSADTSGAPATDSRLAKIDTHPSAVAAAKLPSPVEPVDTTPTTTTTTTTSLVRKVDSAVDIDPCGSSPVSPISPSSSKPRSIHTKQSRESVSVRSEQSNQRRKPAGLEWLRDKDTEYVNLIL
ncbi:uncharacterized protein BJ171DRAFT_578391 [Polychytrium aggregatum]|uniref:uncharacterized protein n=1 Tax=Polychytrium aggregatum TaxID=110093 RepID=UPI0022FEA265|nr:uncharacterized protein BJ171DRAFT_578391 [Polychytrium aggregatum]KAI9207914.1 hypothetical protein BJ171DRAFT_578391 [Polychytrium aggregatum]